MFFQASTEKDIKPKTKESSVTENVVTKAQTKEKNEDKKEEKVAPLEKKDLKKSSSDVSGCFILTKEFLIISEIWQY